MNTLAHPVLSLSSFALRAMTFIALALVGLTLPSVGDAADGKALYESTCIACHGSNGKGTIPGVPDMAARLAKPDAELKANILNGFQTPGSPMAMPAKGGNPSLTEEDVQAIIDYLRTMDAATTPSSAINSAPDSVLPAASLETSTQANKAVQNVSSFSRGAKSWADNCARCHAMRDPKSNSDAQWKVVVNHMRLRAGLEGQQARDILAFLQETN